METLLEARAGQTESGVDRVHRSRRLALILALLAACGESTGAPADGAVSADAAAPAADTGALPRDASQVDAAPGHDAGFSPRDTGTSTATDGSANPLPCEPQLAAAADRPAVLAFDLTSIEVRGGTGAHEFRLSENNSGAIVNLLSGAYVAGGRTGVTDRVTITDRGCVGETTVNIRVVDPMVAAPLAVELPFGGGFRFEVSGGSGRRRFQLDRNAGGGTITSSGAYTAGMQSGRDTVRIADVDTRQSIIVNIDVVEGAVLRPFPPQVVIAAGSRYRLDVRGGSGVFTLSPPSTAEVGFTNGDFVAAAPGHARFEVLDSFTGQRTSLDVDVITPHAFTSTRGGDYLASGVILAPGDLDGDGKADVVAGYPESDAAGFNTGAVFVFRGSPQGGLDPVPAQILTTAEREARLGRAVAIADVDGDGLRDLVAGADGSDLGGVDSGALLVFAGVANGFFSGTPSVIPGLAAGDALGYALTACDFDGDGRTDVAAGAWGAEDRMATPVRSAQGAVFLFLGTQVGLRAQPDAALWGQIPDAQGRLTGVTNLRFGVTVASGDVDGDGGCDLAAATYFHDPPGGGPNDGVAYVYRGGAGGLRSSPSFGVASGGAPGDTNTQLGRNLAVGDLDGDGRAEVVISEYVHDGTRTNQGALRIFRGRPLTDVPLASLLAPADADLTIEGRDAEDQYGWTAAIGDVNGDAIPDLVSGNFRDEVRGGVAEAGTVTVFAGRRGALPLASATATIAGATAEERFGSAIAVAGDLDGDRAPDLVVLAGRDDFYGFDYGRFYLEYGGAPRPHLALGTPALPAGDMFGRGLAVARDLDGDGFDDLLAGAPLADHRARGPDSGAVFLYRGRAAGFEAQPAMIFAGFRGHTSLDQTGWRVAGAGDFDGDGTNDLAMIARLDDRPASFSAASYAVEPGCPAAPAATNTGAVYVFRGRRGQLPEAEPAYVFYGPQAGQGVRSLAGGFDHDGDGLGDIAIGALEWDRGSDSAAGGFQIIRGRARDPQGRIAVICSAAVSILGGADSDYLGRSIAPLGDLDGDGCDEIAVGAQLEDLGRTNQGTVRVIFGAGRSPCPAAPRVVVLGSGTAGAQAGISLAGGSDVDGDMVLDIAVGGPQLPLAPALPAGAAWVISGAYVVSLPREDLADGVDPTAVHPFSAAGDTANRLVVGLVSNEQLGTGVALVPGGLVAGGPLAEHSGTPLSGGARVYGWSTAGLSRVPRAAFGGEPLRGGGLLGHQVATARLGARTVVIVGGYSGSGVGTDRGAVYSFDLR